MFSRDERRIVTNYIKLVKIGIDTLMPVLPVSIRIVSSYLAYSVYK